MKLRVLLPLLAVVAIGLAACDPPPPPPPPPRPPPLVGADLAPVDIAWPVPLVVGDRARFQITVRNSGDTATPANTIVDVLVTVDGIDVGWSDNVTVPLAPGETRVQAVNGGPDGSDGLWGVTAGSHTVQAYVNSGSLPVRPPIPESTRDNNTQVKTFRVESPGRIAFVSDRTGNPELWVMDSDGSNQTQLTNDADIEREPKLSPDGTQILFVRWNGQTGGSPAVPNQVLWVVNTDGSNAHSVFAPPAHSGGRAPPTVSDDRDPSWSPDGTQIAFYREGVGINMSGLMVMNADGSGARVVRPQISDSIRITQLAWSPDGTRIAYTYDYVCCGWHVVFVNTDGSGPDFTPLIGPRFGSDIETSDWAPAWSPDGARIAFTGRPNVNGTVGPEGLWVANATGAANPTALNAAGIAPTWSPGGDRIAFERAGSIWTIDPDGGNQMNLTVGSQPSWGPKT